MQNDILCVIEHGPKQNAKQENHKTHQWAMSVKSEATKLYAETRDPPSQDPRDHKEQPYRHDIIPRHSEANTDNAGSQREW